jgi:hypothetical protein
VRAADEPVTLSRSDAGTLIVEIAPPGLSDARMGLIASCAFIGTFSVAVTAWYTTEICKFHSKYATGPDILDALAFEILVLTVFILVAFVKPAELMDPLLGYELSIGQYAFGACALLPGGRTLHEVSGPKEELEGASVEIWPRCVVLHLSRGRKWVFGHGLEFHARKHLVDEINQQLRWVATQSDVVPSFRDDDWPA